MTNEGTLLIASPHTIKGSFTEAAAGVLDLDFAGDVRQQYGALTLTNLTTLDGGLAIDLTEGFTLATGDRFDILNSQASRGPASTPFRSTAWGARRRAPNSWSCRGGVRLKEDIFATSLDLVVTHGDPAGFAAPEPSTWAMLALGFLGLGLRGRLRAA